MIHIKSYLASAAVLFFCSCSSKVMNANNEGSSPAGANLKVMTYNIHHANPPSKTSGEIDLEAIAKVIRTADPDVVALQEVDYLTDRSGKVDQAKALGDLLNMKAYFGKAINYGGGDYGVAILSKYPLADTKTVHLPEDAHPASEDRVIALATVKLPGNRKLRFGSTHWDVSNNENRKLQAKAINKLAEGEKLPFIVAGDLNATTESEPVRILDQQFSRTCSSCGFTIPVERPDRTIDHIAFAKKHPFTVVSQQVINETYASDHLPVVATLRRQ